uniref:Uncharacterized protein n=1 Tax=Myotis myotis TaxID=51298 RepID=A0A7J7U5N1_MYOMY|nr:hypothetical protein mMyoMyo1_008893 [Myotis myotis]
MQGSRVTAQPLQAPTLWGRESRPNAGPSPGPPAPSAGLPGPACRTQFPSQAGPAAAEMPRKVALASCWHQRLSTPGDSGDPCVGFQGPPSFSRSFLSPWPGPSQMPAAPGCAAPGNQGPGLSVPLEAERAPASGRMYPHRWAPHPGGCERSRVGPRDLYC